MRSALSLLPALLAACTMAAPLPEWARALAAVPAFLWMPGRGFALRLTTDPLRRALDAFWISALLAIPSVWIAAWTGLGAPGALAGAATFTALGSALRAPRARPLAARWRLAVFASIGLVAMSAWAWRDTLTRPLERHWWFAGVEEPEWAGMPPARFFGWASTKRFGDATRLTPRGPHPFLLGPMEGPILLVISAPVGASMRVGDQEVVVAADVVERADEGAVPRYLDRGVATIRLNGPLDPGERLDLALSRPEGSVLYLIPSRDALWELHAAGELRFVHYYQLLNMVEQVRWARELYADRRVTDVQPPLWSYALAGPVVLVDGDLPTQAVLLLGLLLLQSVAGLAFLRAWAPGCPWPALLVPAAATCVHAKLMLEPGSQGLPDSVYALALTCALTALATPGPRYAASALLAQLTRYPGAVVAGLGAVLDGQFMRAARMLGVVLLVAAGFAAGGALTGSLGGWAGTVWWETFPEHWHGDADPARLLGRAPRFYGLWLAYAGGMPLLALVRWPRGTRVALGTALLYSTLLATIDHAPSHYFLPLLHLSALAVGTTSDTFARPALRLGIPLLALLGLWISVQHVPVTG